MLRLLLIGLPVLVGILSPAQARAAEKVDYLREIKPLLSERCYACHGALQQKGDLRLDTLQFMRMGGTNGPAIVPKKPAESLLLAHLTATEGKRRMPPASEGELLSEPQITKIRIWIEQGATGPSDEKPEPDPKDHWAFRAPVRPTVPVLKQTSRVRNPVDAFLEAEREKRGLVLQPPADRRVLLRRLYLDLTGLPPAGEELQAFARSTTPDVDYGRIVDRLLASPQYGERWGRHLMDLWRYSDWWGLGAEVRNSQKHIWHWRDWIIESLNADRPYDQMIREMLAADELYPNDLDRLRATGFLARQYFKFNRNTWLEETIEHTSKAFLGLTMNCAKCHDHKYDPITQQDYYRFRAFFEPYQIRTEMVPGQPDFEKDGIPRAFDCNLDAPTYRFVRGDEKQPVKDRPLTPGLPPLLALGELKIEPVKLPMEAHTPGLRPYVVAEQVKQAEAQIAAAQAAVEQAKKALAEAEKRPLVEEPKPMLPRVPGASAEIKETVGKVLVKDDFAAMKPEVWLIGPGRWKYENGKLLQQMEGMTRSAIRLKQRPPENFEARVKFTITGGEPYRSVGISFDVAGDNENLVYVSAAASGQKVQVSYKLGTNHVYPVDGALGRPIPVKQELELTLRVRGPLVNVALNGEHAVAYRLPVPRKAGDLELVTFTALAEFQAFELRTLPEEIVLVEKKAAQQPMPLVQKPLTVAQARTALALAEKSLELAKRIPDSLRARAAAGRTNPPEVEPAQKAAESERAVAIARAEEALARAEHELALADAAKRADAEKKRNAAREALAVAQKAPAKSTQFTPLRGALKTVESTTESEAQRNRPFPTTSTGRRTALAQWMTDRRHPLTARVMVNHVWLRHFGQPLVPTIFDFGRKGSQPTHPELLDWLAMEFMESGWSFRHLHRLMVLSETYRATSSSVGAKAEADAENRSYWRMNSRRMDAPTLRDSLLHLAGELDPKMGGPSIPVNDEASRRRSLYFVHSHNDHQKFLSIFDDANVLECYRRAESILPQQALALSNSRFALTMAGKINTRLHEQLGTVSDADFVRAAFETVLANAPSEQEQALCEEALKELAGEFKGQADPNRRARETLIQSLLNHNDFITIR